MAPCLLSCRTVCRTGAALKASTDVSSICLAGFGELSPLAGNGEPPGFWSFRLSLAARRSSRTTRALASAGSPSSNAAVSRLYARSSISRSRVRAVGSQCGSSRPSWTSRVTAVKEICSACFLYCGTREKASAACIIVAMACGRHSPHLISTVARVQQVLPKRMSVSLARPLRGASICFAVRSNTTCFSPCSLSLFMPKAVFAINAAASTALPESRRCFTFCNAATSSAASV
mmetsp:Transcript_19564/g.42242  ORF Transcript_19564/g.42242 Transcript_19564/m.42242 type:complete len:232 (-) Transcript_19564:147-842(-)